MSRTTTRLAVSLALLLPLAVAGVAGAGPSGGALPPVLIEQLTVAGRHGIPDDAAMVAANVTAVDPAEPGHLTVFPCDEDVPATSNVNYVAGDVAPNLVLSRIAGDGTICIATHAVSDVIVDLVGYVPAGSAVTPLPTPLRFIDTREDGPEPVRAGSALWVSIADLNGVPADADVVVFNATAIALDQPGHLTAYPCGEALPSTSSVNFTAHQVVPNMITSRIGADGAVCLHTVADVEIVVDVVAYSNSGIEPLANPVRLIDTRTTNTPVAADGVLTVDITSRGDIPDDATAAVYNLTAVTPTAPGFATSYPCDIERPLVSNLNYLAGQVVANGTITKLSDAGELCIYTLAESHLIVDLVGYTRGTTDYVPLTPVRIRDTREGWQRTCDWFAFRIDQTSVEFWNIDTEELRSVDVSSLDGFTGPFRTSGAPCGTTLISADDDGDGQLDLVRIELDGSSMTVLDGLPELDAALADVGFDGTRYVGATAAGDVWDLTNNTKLADGTGHVGSYTRLSDDNSLAVDSVSGGAGSTTITTFDVASGTELGAFEVAADTVAVPSPDGAYVAVPLSSTEVAILGVFGDVVDLIELRDDPQVPTDITVTAAWASAGELLLCQRTWSLHRYELFGEPQLVAELLTKPSPGTNSARLFCPAVP